MSDHRALITQLCDELDHNRRMLLDDRRVTHPLADRARAALVADGPAVPEGREPAAVMGEPSDEGLLEIARTVALIEEDGSTGYLDFADVSHLVLDFARAVLARWGRQPAPPAEGEDKAPAVTEVIAWLRTEAEIDDGFELTQSAAYQRRAADLLEQRHPAPVPVSERLPGPEDCDAEGRVWGTAELGGWRLVHHSKIGLWRAWLPAHALPLPAGEVEK